MIQLPKVLHLTMTLPSHIASTNNKRAANKYWKINNQAIYNGSVDKFKRAVIVENMHNLVMNSLPQSALNLKIDKVKNITYIFNTVRNHGSISRRLGKTCWKPAKKDYVSNWDSNNISDIWVKTGNDALTLAGVITDDNTDVINNTTYRMEVVDHIEDLKLQIIITY